MSLNQLKIYNRYRFYKRSQYWDRQTIERHQFQRVREVLLHAGRNVPYYRELFKSVRFDPEKFTSLKDIENLPLMDRNIVRRIPEQLICDSTKNIKGSWCHTSGSTGSPIRLFIDENSKVNKYAATLRAYNWAGYFPGNRALVIQDYTGKTEKQSGYRFFSNSLFFHAPSMTRESVLKFYRLLRLVRPKFLIGYGRSYLNLYRHLKELNLEIPNPSSIINYGENINQEESSNLKRYYNSEFYDFYCHYENVAMAANIRPDEMFLMEDYFYPEVIDDHGELVEEGVGELVGTGFYNYAMPLIRYKTGDLIELKNSFKGKYTQFRPVVQIQGRVNDKVVTPEGQEFYFLGFPLWGTSGIISSQYVQEAVDKLELRLLTDDQFRMDSMEIIRKNIQQKIGDQIDIDIRIVDQLERKNSGKIPAIISRLR